MRLIKRRKGKKKGIHGVSVRIFDQYQKPIYSKGLTVHGLTVDQIFERVKFFLKFEESKSVQIILEE